MADSEAADSEGAVPGRGALADGRAAAFKIADGSARGRVPVTVGLLRELGAETQPGADADALAALATSPVYGGGEVVGEIRATSGWLS